MKKIFLTITMAFALLSAMVINAADTNKTSEVFSKNEVSLQLFGQWSDNNTITVQNLKKVNDYAGGASLTLFPLNYYVGVRASTYLSNLDGKFIDNAAGDLVLRLPIQKLRIAPYGVIGYNYDFGTKGGLLETGGGVECRLFKGWGVFAEYNYDFKSDVRVRDHQVLKAGLSLKF